LLNRPFHFSAGLAVMIERAVELLIGRVEKQRFAQTKSPRRDRVSGAKKSGRSVKSAAFSRCGSRAHS
jgi:hypothetical protein